MSVTNTVTAPDPAVVEVVDFAVSFASLSRDGKRYRIKRNVGDLVHALGYFSEQKTGRTNGSVATRLNVLADALRLVADNLQT